MKRRADPFRTHRTDVTDWSIRRMHGKDEEKLAWGPPGDSVEATGWDIDELSHETVRARWGAGSYRVYFTGYNEAGRRRPRGRTAVVTLHPMPGDPVRSPAPGTAPKRAPVTVVEALRAAGNEALAATIEQHLKLFGSFLLRRGM